MNDVNLRTSRRLMEFAAASGVKTVCVCAGSRNSPLVAAFCASSGFELLSFFDERSAAFFALGRMKRDGRPVAVITTSGTAVAELFPAVIEAHYSGLPLLCVTADRPRAYRGTGAPQSIEQKNIFGVYVETSVDFEATEPWPAFRWNATRPCHLNVAFEEPLVDGPLTHFIADTAGAPAVRASSDAANERKRLADFLRGRRRPLVILGALPRSARPAVARYLSSLGAAVYAEALSGLREDKALESVAVKSGERILAEFDFDAVVRIGGVPTLRYWRDLEAKRRHLPVLHVTELPFTGLSRGDLCRSNLAEFFLGIDSPAPVELPPNFRARDLAAHARLLELFSEEPRSEVALIHALSRLVPDRAHVFLGNSLAIREWDLVAQRRPRGLEFRANRGANGIDGELSAFLGGCGESHPNWALVGDLTALYDLSSPMVLEQLPEDLAFQIAIVNNGGGKIFSRVKSLETIESPMRRAFFENTHRIRFGDWAKMWNLGFEEWERIPPHLPASTQGVVELRPDAKASERFWAKYDAFWGAP